MNFSSSPTKLDLIFTEVVVEVNELRDRSGWNNWKNVCDDCIDFLTFFGFSNSQTDSLSVFSISSSSINQRGMESMNVIMFIQKSETWISIELPYPIVLSLLSYALKYTLSSSILALQFLCAMIPFSLKMTVFAHWDKTFKYFVHLLEFGFELLPV